MVGLPARGKTYISQKVRGYLEWMGTSCKVFNVGMYRRQTAGANCRSDFFDPTNKEAIALRNEAATMALHDMLKWFDEEDGCVAIYDATNTTRERRDRVHKVCKDHGIEVIFIESICHDPDVIINNITEVKVSGPDYAGMDPELATEDFKARMRHYEKAYETIAEEDRSFIKLINVGSLVIVNLIKGWLQSRIVYFLMNLHTQPRRILFSRHGESMYNQLGLLGGDSDLSPRGQLYAQSLPSVIRRALGSAEQPLTVWTSTLKRTQQTAAYLEFTKLAWKALDELDAGVCDGMTYEEIEQKYPEDYLERDKDKFRYRYRGGESYHDVVVRLEPIIMELERQRNILIIGHQAILRCIYAYFMKIPHDELPYIKIPLHTVISITPRAYGCDEERYSVDIPAVDTHRDPRRAHSSSGIARSPSASLSDSASSAASAAAGADANVAIASNGLKIRMSATTVSSVPAGPFPISPATPRGSTAGVGGDVSTVAAAAAAAAVMSASSPAPATNGDTGDPAAAAAAAGLSKLSLVDSMSSPSSTSPAPSMIATTSPLTASPGSPTSLVVDTASAATVAAAAAAVSRPSHPPTPSRSGTATPKSKVGSPTAATAAGGHSLVPPEKLVNAPHLAEVDAAEAGAEPGVKVTVVEPEPTPVIPGRRARTSDGAVDDAVIGGQLVD
ncbi:Fructose-2,6-bisphosphatase [Blastocladiella emersonii ATCC 22665]|nr:Fructose-2,6-bisphosphatase [Blastocladiella emersonii ATCC 22665]